MRRAVSIGLALVALVVVIVLLASESSGGEYRVAALFDTANGIVPGQQVKVAGAVVGSVESVDLAGGRNGFNARIVMDVEHRFAPFRANATCTILPEGLISENYVQCTPGSGQPLSTEGGTPTVPLDHTTVPFSLQDALNVLSLPTDERIQVLISQLGIGTAAQGSNVNALLRRANPALQTSQQLLQILDAQRQQLAGAVGQTDEILAALAQRGDQVRQFVDRAAAVTATAAAHRTALAQTVARLPAMLAAARPDLAALDSAARNATPLLPELRAAAPSLTGLTTALPEFSREGVPALTALGAATQSGTPAVTQALPVVADLNRTTRPLSTLSSGLSQLLVSSRDEGAFEGIESVIYAFATNTALYDNTSHILTFTVNIAPQCIIGQEGGFNVAGCGHSNTSPDQGQVPLNEPGCGPKSLSFEEQTCPAPTPGPLALDRAPASVTRRLQTALDTVMNGGVVKTAVWRQLGSLLGLLKLPAPSASSATPAAPTGANRPAQKAATPAPSPAGSPSQPTGGTGTTTTPSLPAPVTSVTQGLGAKLSTLLNYLLK
jgi:virulence factor Mce-like protein